MAYYSDGTLTSSKLQIDDADGWDTQTEWEAYQSINQAEIVSGAVQLAQIDQPPDSGDLLAHYDATELSLNDSDAVDPWPDQTANNHDLTAGAAPTYVASALNGNPVVRFDGVDDYLDVAFASEGQPLTIAAVVRRQGAGASTEEWLDGNDTSVRSSHAFARNGNFATYSGSWLETTIQNNNANVWVTLEDGTSSLIRINGTQEASGDAGTQGLGGLTMGASAFDSAFANADIGEVLVYPQDKSGIFADIETYLGNKWGITV